MLVRFWIEAITRNSWQPVMGRFGYYDLQIKKNGTADDVDEEHR